MTIKATTVYTEELALRADNLRPRSRGSLWTLAILCCLADLAFLVVGCACVFWGQDSVDAAFAAGCCSILAIALSPLAVTLVYGARHPRAAVNPLVGASVYFELTNDWIAIRIDHPTLASQAYALYSHFDKVTETRDFFILHYDNGLRRYALDKHGITTGNVNELRSLLQAAFPAAKYLVARW